MSIKPVNKGGAEEIEKFAMANCLMMLSSQMAAAAGVGGGGGGAAFADQGRMFSCKTCGRKFASFQALGGHRASHKKIKPSSSGDISDGKSSSPPKPKTHACSICGLEFPIGQALGGHMRRHRPILPSAAAAAGGSTVTTENSVENSDGNNKERKRSNDVVVVPVLKKSSSCKRVCLDLNLNSAYWEDDGVVYDHDLEIEEGEIVEEEQDHNKKEERDFLKLELRPPIYNWSVAY